MAETEAELKAKVEELTRKLDEFRNTNSGLQKALARFEGIDPDAVKALEADKKRLEDEQRVKEGKLTEVIAEKIKAALAPVQAERDALNGRLTSIQVDQAVITEATKRGLRPTATEDVKARARSAIRLVEGEARIFDGDKVRTGKDGFSPMSLAEWVEALGTDAPHLFQANAGSGAAGSGSGGAAGGVVNPWDSKTENLTEQMRLLRKDPGLAARLQALANK